jgi:hypothetical protein
LFHCRNGGGGLRLTRTEEKRLEPDPVFIEYFEHFKKKIKKIVDTIYLILFITDIIRLRFNMVYRVKGINLRVSGFMFSGLKRLEGICLWGLEINW